ncbi:MAG TPA: hypothetical protein VGU25_15995 [Acidobacteriaceae bacterium]|nr:hypothetical protein [Acidobacteriaceae bacterium]
MLRAIHPICLLALAFSAIPALAQSPWNGTWKLNQAKSHMTGDTYTLTKSGDTYHMNGGSFQFDYACDGKDYPIFGGETVSCKETPTTVDSVYKQNGKTVQTTKHQLDASGKSYTSISTNMLAAGGTTVSKTTFTRVGQGTGFTGTWKSTSTSTNHVETFTLAVNGNSLHVDVPEEHVTWEGKLDGTPAAVHGPNVPDGVMISEKLEGPKKMVSDVTVDGKHVSHSEDTMNADGKSYTEITWDPTKPNEKQTYVYEKQ